MNVHRQTRIPSISRINARIRLIIVVVTAITLLTAACSAGGSRRAGVAVDQQGLATAQEQLESLEKTPVSIGIDQPIVPLPSGKTVIYLECAVVDCKLHAEALAQASVPLGINLKTISSGLSPESFKSALATAQSLKPDGLIYDAIPAAIAQGPVDAMAASGVAVVAISSPDLKLTKNTANVLGAPYVERAGRGIANWTINDSQGTAQVLYLDDPTLSFSSFISKGLHDTYSENCPSCAIDTLVTSSSEIGTSLPTKVASYLQAHPQIKYINAEYSALLTGVPTALKNAGMTGIKTIGMSPTQINQQYMKDELEAAGVFNNNAAMSWYAADTVARMINGRPALVVAEDPPNLQIMSASEVTWDPKLSSYPFIPGWRDMFIKAWTGR